VWLLEIYCKYVSVVGGGVGRVGAVGGRGGGRGLVLEGKQNSKIVGSKISEHISSDVQQQLYVRWLTNLFRSPRRKMVAFSTPL